MPTAARGEFTEAARKYRADVHRTLSPAERGEEFITPALMALVQGEFIFADTDAFMEEFEWSLLDTPRTLTEGEFAIRDSAMEFAIDLDGKKLSYSFVNEQDHLALDRPVEGWDENSLCLWLDRQVRQIYVPPSELLRWLRDAVTHLTKVRGIPISALWRPKYPLAQKLGDKIKSLRQEARKKAYQLYLFAPEAKTAISFENGFRFFKDMYYDAASIAEALSSLANIFLERTECLISAVRKAMAARSFSVRKC
jgi:type III restriction enzyme